jgi:hypothetical protein
MTIAHPRMACDAFSRACLWITRHWPISAISRFGHPLYLWFLRHGSNALIAEIYGDE